MAPAKPPYSFQRPHKKPVFTDSAGSIFGTTGREPAGTRDANPDIFLVYLYQL